MDRAVLETSSDRYVIVEYLAEGGMGAIYLGKKLGVGGFEKEVVLKQLLPEFTREPKFIDLFLREARLSASLEHANIVHTIDLVNAGDDYFMVMEYVKGADLRTLLKRVRRRHQRFVPQAGVFIGHEILEALAYAHAKTANDGRPLNLIHRDISPSNILLSGAGEVKLTDFGIAKASTHRSVFYKVKGKVGYMSPEQARGEAVDARSDLFSLGVVLYEVLVGERLFVGDLMSSASQIYAQPIMPPSQKRPEIPGDLDAVILKSLSLEPAGRYQSAEEFQEALSRVATRHRLLIGASEMAAHLSLIAGEEPSMWLKLEVFGPERGEPTQSHGTAVLSTSAEDDEEAQRSQFDLSDDDEEAEDDRDDILMRYRNRPPSLPTGELTSVIALRRNAGSNSAEMLTKVRDEPPLPPLAPRRSEPLAAGLSSAPRRAPSASAGGFGHEESRSETLVRDSSPRTVLPSSREPSSRESSSREQPSREQPSREQLSREPSLREPGRDSSSRDASFPSLREPSRDPSHRDSSGRDASPRNPMPLAAPTDETLVHPPSLPNLKISPSLPSLKSPDNSLASSRRVPKSGIRPRPARAGELTDPVRGRPRRMIAIMIVLLLIGIGVALGVAFSGPEIDVVDPPVAPVPAATSPSGTSPTHTPPPPTELPSPPAATPGTR